MFILPSAKTPGRQAPIRKHRIDKPAEKETVNAVLVNAVKFFFFFHLS